MIDDSDITMDDVRRILSDDGWQDVPIRLALSYIVFGFRDPHTVRELIHRRIDPAQAYFEAVDGRKLTPELRSIFFPD